MHYLIAVFALVVVTFIVRSERSQTLKLAVGTLTAMGLVLQFLTPYRMVGALLTGFMGVGVAWLLCSER
jgi:hypothetical protein